MSLISRMMSRWWVRYGSAVLVFGLTLGLSLVLRHFDIRINFTIPIAAGLVAVSWFAGRGPGVLLACLLVGTTAATQNIPENSTIARVAFAQFSVLLLLLLLVWLISGRRKIESELREQHQLLDVTLSSIGDAVVATDTEKKITFINPAAENLLGVTSDDVACKPLTEVLLLSDADTGEPVDPTHLVSAENEADGRSHTLSLATDSRSVPVDATCSSMKDPDGNEIGAVIALRDVSERRRVEIERDEILKRERAARSEAEAANRMKDEFLATVSHELRTPLNAIVGWATLLRENRFGTEQLNKALSVIERNAKVQNTLISDILDVSRIVTGKMRIDSHPVDIMPVLRASIEAAYPSARAKNIEIRTDYDAQDPVIAGDAERIQQIFWNLISNAIKFTPNRGHINVRMTSDRDNVRISFHDTGVGIERESLPLIFEKFQQVDSSTKRVHGGLGLGLAIVRHLTELHGGTVDAVSDGEGLGATFSVQFPLLNAAQRGTPAVQQAADAPDLTGVRVLIVDDHQDTLEMFRQSLENHGAETRAANNVAVSMSIFDEWEPDVVLTDLGMPGQDGFDLLKQIRKRGTLNARFVPVAAVTAYTHREMQDEINSAGFQSQLTKPVDTPTLLRTVAQLASNSETSA